MVINLEPQIAQNSLFFVPPEPEMPMLQRFDEMADPELNATDRAWSVARTPLEQRTWELQAEDFEVENPSFPIRRAHGEYLQDTTPLSRDQKDNIKSTYTTIKQRPSQTNREDSIVTAQYNPNGMVSYDISSPMLGTGYAQNGSFTAFQNCRTSSRLSMAEVSFGSNPSDTSVMEDSYFTIDKTSPTTVDSNYSTKANYTDTYEASHKRASCELNNEIHNWFEDRRNGDGNECLDGFGFQRPQDGLPRSGGYHDRFETPLNFYSDTQWTAGQSASSDTITPGALNLDVPVPLISTTAANQLSALTSFEQRPSAPDAPIPFRNDGAQMRNEGSPGRRPRHMLPSARPTFKREGVASSAPPRSESLVHRTARQRQPTPKQARQERTKASTPVLSAVSNTRSHTQKAELSTSKPILPPTPPPPPSSPPPLILPPKSKTQTCAPGQSQPQSVSELPSEVSNDRKEKDIFLVKSKNAGKSYKSIRAEGNFTEAESTLRGRFRTLTKAKEARVRKPEWTDNDIRLLKKAVKPYSRSDPSLSNESKIPWKKVAEYISSNGGSYQFGYATCRRRWDELQFRRPQDC